MGFLAGAYSLLLSFDLMTNSPNLKIEGKNCYRTAIGGMMNLILTVLSIIGVIYFGKALVVKSEPLVVQSSMEGKTVGPFPIQVDEFNIYMGIEFPNFTYYVNDRIYSINATLEVYRFDKTKGQTYEIKLLDFGICSKYYNDSSAKNNFDLNYFWCFAPNQAQIQGYWGSEITSIAKFYISKCSNSTENNNHCLPNEEINNYIQGGILSMFTTNSFLNLNDAENPVEVKLQNWYNSLNIDFTYDYFYSVKELAFEDDKGFLLQDINVKSYFYFENPLILYYGKRDDLLATINLQGYRFGTRIQRSYTKIQDVLTKIGGLLKAITLIASFIANLSSHSKFYSDSIHNFNTQLCKYNANTTKISITDNYKANFGNISEDNYIVNYVNKQKKIEIMIIMMS